MTETEKQAIFAFNVARLLTYIQQNGYLCSLGEAWRTPEQAALYAKQGKGIKDSLHCKRLAIDLNLFDTDGRYLTKHEDYKQFGDYWVTLHPHNRWGGQFIALGGKIDDPDHFEMQDF